ncbi:MAG TPA: hypothetical protein VI729_06550 [Anaerolineales bacterium]|nr:hypothetical protein [Anaerolineales bacterium]
MNTYENNPSAGLSQLQRAILGRIFDVEQATQSMQDAAGYPVDPEVKVPVKLLRPYGEYRAMGASTTRAMRGPAQRAALSKSLRRLRERGLIEGRWRSQTGYTSHVTLTDQGRRVAQNLPDDPTYRDLWGEGLTERIILDHALLAPMGLGDRCGPDVELDAGELMILAARVAQLRQSAK